MVIPPVSASITGAQPIHWRNAAPVERVQRLAKVRRAQTRRGEFPFEEEDGSTPGQHYGPPPRFAGAPTAANVQAVYEWHSQKA